MGTKKINEAPVRDAMALNSATLSDEIQHLVGDTATLLEKPSSDVSALHLFCEAGNFRVQVGDTTATIDSSDPSASVTDGTGSLKISEGSSITIASPKDLTVIGDGAGAILTYFWT